MTSEQRAAARRKRIEREIRASNDAGLTEAEIQACVDDEVMEEEYDEHQDREELRAMGRLPGQYDSPCLDQHLGY